MMLEVMDSGQLGEGHLLCLEGNLVCIEKLFICRFLLGAHLLLLFLTSLIMKMSTEKKFLLTFMRTIGKFSNSRLLHLDPKSGEFHFTQSLMTGRMQRSLKSLKA